MKPGMVQLNYKGAEVLNKSLGDSQGVWLKAGKILLGEADLKKQ